MDAERPLLEVRDLAIRFGENRPAVDRVSFTVRAGETLALVGESGSGKSLTALSTVRLLPDAASVSGSVRFEGREMLGAPDEVLREVRGNEISFVFQEPMTSLNPLHTIEKQIGEILKVHRGMSDTAARTRTLELLVDFRLTGDREVLPGPRGR